VVSAATLFAHDLAAFGVHVLAGLGGDSGAGRWVRGEPEGAVLTYMRSYHAQAELAEYFGVSQPTISRAVTGITPMLRRLLGGWVPVAEDLDRGAQYIIDGTLLPCWLWRDHPELYSGKHKTTSLPLEIAAAGKERAGAHLPHLIVTPACFACSASTMAMPTEPAAMGAVTSSTRRSSCPAFFSRNFAGRRRGALAGSFSVGLFPNRACKFPRPLRGDAC
jgi:hypothetical protein